MRRQGNVSLLLVHRLRRWHNFKQTLVQCLVFAGQLDRLNNAPVANWWETPSLWEARGPGPTGAPPLGSGPAPSDVIHMVLQGNNLMPHLFPTSINGR